MGHILLSFLFYNILVIIFYTRYKRGGYYIKKSDLIFYTLLLIAFGTYGGGEGDYLHYKEAVEDIHSLADVLYNKGMEIQYYYLAYILGGNYTIWRLVVYSIQFVGLGWFLFKAKLNTYPILLAFTSLFLVTSVYGRVYWGVIYFFMGCYLLIEKKNPLYLIAIALCYVSHTSNLILIALLPLSFINLKKWHLVLIIILFGTIISVFNDYFSAIIDNGGVEGADYLNVKMNSYSTQTANYNNFWGNSIGEIIIFMMRHIPLLLIMLQLLLYFIGSYGKFKNIYKPLRRIINVYFGINLVALIFLFADMNNGAYFYRVLAMSFFAITLILPYMVEYKIITKRVFNTYLVLFLVASEANYLKDLYYAYMGGA